MTTGAERNRRHEAELNAWRRDAMHRRIAKMTPKPKPPPPCCRALPVAFLTVFAVLLAWGYLFMSGW